MSRARRASSFRHNLGWTFKYSVYIFAILFLLLSVIKLKADINNWWYSYTVLISLPILSILSYKGRYWLGY